MIETFLDNPLIPLEGIEDSFNANATLSFIKANKRLKSKEFDKALLTLEPLLGKDMSKRQWVRLGYYLGQIAIERHQFEQARDFLLEALDYARDLQDHGACAVLAKLLGTSFYCLNEFKDAAFIYDLALKAWCIGYEKKSPSQSDRRIEIDIRTSLAIQIFWTGAYKEAADELHRACLLADHCSYANRLRARAWWLLALVYRWRAGADEAQRYEYILNALKYAKDALDYYEVRGMPMETSRMFNVMADILLDSANIYARDGNDAKAQESLVEAKPYIDYVIERIPKTLDLPSGGMNRLTEVRYLRAINDQQRDRVALIDSVITLARKEDDHALLGQGLAARGDEHFSRAEYDSAIQFYRWSLDEFTAGKVEGLALWARLALTRIYQIQGIDDPQQISAS